MKGIATLLILLSLPLLVNAAEVYQWVDDQGITHFTDDPAAVPEDYREETEIRQMEESLSMESSEESEGFTGSEDFGVLGEEGILVEDDLKEKDEQWWRGLAEKWTKNFEEAYANYETVRLRYNDMATEFNSSKDPEKRKELKAELDRMQIEMKKNMADFEEARKITDEVLPSYAQKAGIPIEWVR
jgi:hypothetical protein